MITDQASKLRQLVKEGAPARLADKRARVIAFTSGKGGVGKTNLAVGFSIAAAQLGHKVVLLDADLGLANVNVVLNLRARYNIAHVLTGQKRLSEVLVAAPGGILVLPGASGLTHLADLQDENRKRLIDRMEYLEQKVDLFVIDTGAGISKNVVQFLLCADDVVLVTSNEPTSITDAYSMIKVLARREYAGEVRLVVNMAESAREADAIAEKIAANSSHFLDFYVQSAGHVLRDKQLIEAVKRREPFMLSQPNSAAAKCVRQVVENVLRGEAPAQAGFLSRMLGWFGG